MAQNERWLFCVRGNSTVGIFVKVANNNDARKTVMIMRRLAVFPLCYVLLATRVAGLDNGVARLPPLGWSSWNGEVQQHSDS